jgi:hypothetical protein
MAKETATRFTSDKGKAVERTPSGSAPNPPMSLQQLKVGIENTPGIIKNIAEARGHLEKKLWLQPEQDITCQQLSTILLSLVSTQGQRNTTDKLSENTANIIKSVAFLLEETTPAQNDGHNPEQPYRQVKESIDTLIATVHERTKTLQKTIEEIKLKQNPDPSAGTHTHTDPKFSYRGALINGTNFSQSALPPPATIHEARLRNRISIDARQILIEIQYEANDPLHDAHSEVPNSSGKIKDAINTWLTNRDGENPPPLNTSIRSITQYGNKKLLIEANTNVAAAWIQQNAARAIQPFVGHPVKILGRQHPVIARFMPVQFQPNEAGIRDLEACTHLPENSITQATWIKNPEQREPKQKYANLKILCNSPEVANNLILGSGRISYLGSQLRFHKDIKAPGTCNRCQNYGHIAPNCKADSPTCTKCGNDHYTSTCQAPNKRCTPCGSEEHQSNDVKCPERIKREEALLIKNPELLTPYYITAERWTWGLPSDTIAPNATNFGPAQQGQRQTKSGPRQRPDYEPSRGPTKRQNTLFNSGFNRQPTQTGSNNIPLGSKNPRNRTPPPSPSPTVRPFSPSQTDMPSSVQPTQTTPPSQ